jgi:hypothetical protein
MVDDTNRDIILFVTKGHSSPYSIWSGLNKQAQGKGMAYINIKKRVLRLAEAGLLERAASLTGANNNASVRDRKDYKVTRKGLEQLVSHVILHPEDVKDITEYNPTFGEMLITKMTPMINSTDECLKSIVHLEPVPLDSEEITRLQRATFELYYRLKTIQSTIVKRSRRQLLARQRVVGSTIKNDRVISGGRDMEITTIIPSKELVEFEEKSKAKSTLVNPIPSARRKKISATLKKRH